jgi:PhnB protein
MSTPFKAVSHSSVSPNLIVSGAWSTIDFLTLVFGAVELRRHATPSGQIMHGRGAPQAPVKKEGDDKRGGVKDAGGTTCWIATEVA